MSEILQHYTNEFRSSRDVSPYDAEVFFDEMISVTDEDALTALLEAWTRKGTTEDELFRFASIMRGRMKRLSSPFDAVTDIVGTGGCSAKTFNVSTAAAFVIAGAGVPVAKHGNRAATSTSGSSDVLSLLGLNVDVDAAIAERSLADNGICFMFAPRFHSLSPTLAGARKRVDGPTIFNNIGPLCNPASAMHQVIGVWNAGLLQRTARVLTRLGTTRSWIVCGDGGFDEIALNGSTRIVEVRDGQIDEFEINTDDFGITSSESELPTNFSPGQSAEVILSVLSNERGGEAVEQLVLINAAAAIYIAGRAKTLPDAYALAEARIRDGSALDKLRRSRSVTE